jgi:hypothetical protein
MHCDAAETHFKYALLVFVFELLWLSKLMSFNTKHILYKFCIFPPATTYEVEGNVTCNVTCLCYLILDSDMFLWIIRNSWKGLIDSILFACGVTKFSTDLFSWMFVLVIFTKNILFS